MNRFSAREFALLCLPVALIAGAGLWVAMRPAPPKPTPLHASFRIEKPTTLEAFKGANTTLIAKVEGGDDLDVSVDGMKTDAFLEVQTAKGTQRGSSQSWTTPSAWDKVWKGQFYSQDGLRLPINSMAIPDGNLAFVFKTRPIVRNPKSGAATATATPMLPLAGMWKIDRSQFAPFDFSTLPRTPQIRVWNVKIVVSSPGLLQGEISFDLLGAGMDAQTPVDFDLSGTVALKNTTYGMGYDSEATVEPKNPLRRIVKWTLGGPTSPPPKTMGHVHGRISANERWPLAFAFEPFDVSKIKAGQNLRFKQWPAPIPK